MLRCEQLAKYRYVAFLAPLAWPRLHEVRLKFGACLLGDMLQLNKE
jgi:hypothetical protein